MSEKVKSYRELLVWQKSIELVKEIYKVIKMFPKEETYALCDQLRRSAVSIPSNIAEGQARQHTGEFKQFLFIALGSLAELDTQLVIANGLGYLKTEGLDRLNGQIAELQKMIRGLVSKLITHHSPLTTNKGFTLVELLIAMAIASVVGMAGVAVFSSSNWAYKLNEDVAEAQQNARVAMERLSKDIRAAGFGLPDPPFSITFTGLPITFVGQFVGSITLTSPVTVTTSGGSTNSDAITVLGIGYEVGKLVGQVAGPPVSGENLSSATSICVEDSDGRFTTQFSNRKYINIGGAVYRELTAAPGIACGGTGKQLTLATPLDKNYPNDTPVFIIQAIQYSIENDCTVSNPCYNLKSNDATELRGTGNQVLAENIEDIQFAYGVDAVPLDGKMDSTTLSNDPITDDSTIVAVRATVVAKARNKDMRGATFTRPLIEDRTSASDNYRRRTLTKIIKLRNPRTGG